MKRGKWGLLAALASAGLLGACTGTEPGPTHLLEKVSGDSQSVAVHATSSPLVVRVVDGEGAPVAGAVVGFSVTTGGGSVTVTNGTSGADGSVSTAYVANTTPGARRIRAELGNAEISFDLLAVPGIPVTLTRTSASVVAVPAGTPSPALIGVVRDSYGNSVPGVEVTWTTTAGTLSQSADTSTGAGAVSVTLTVPGNAGPLTVTGEIPGGPSATWELSAMVDIPVLASVPQPANYSIHDQFVRDGLVFASVWNTGLRIYDVGNGISGGTPALPVLVSTIVTANMGLNCNCVHNAWWFHDPVLGQQRYLFVGQEGPGSVGTSSSGSIHVVDIADIVHPAEVATFTLGAVAGRSTGVHNFWMDEAKGILYAAYYNGGVVSLDVSDTLSGDLGGRLISAFRPSGDAYVWGVMAAGGRIFASDMVRGLWSLNVAANGTISAGAGLGAVSDRYTSDLWVTGNVAYSGTWGSRNGILGNVTKVWELDGLGYPELVDSLKILGITTVSDNEVSPGGELLLATGEGGGAGGLYIYERSDPLHPRLIGRAFIGGGLHTGTFASIGDKLYVFASKNPASPALVVFDVTSLLPTP